MPSLAFIVFLFYNVRKKKCMKKVLLIISGYKKGAEELSKKIVEFLRQNHYEPISMMYDGYGAKRSDKTLNADFDFVISLGGDGNVLFASRFAAERCIPVIPINFGQFGFIANIQPADWEDALKDFLDGKQESHFRLLFNIEVLRSNACIARYTALNEAVVSGSGVAKLISLELIYNEMSFGIFRADGVIVATPTGSTAYAVASGGPILDPTLNALVISPIAPFTLSNRPVVLPTCKPLIMKVLPQRQKELLLSIDGQESVLLREGDEVRITQSETKVNLIGCSQKHFYEALRAKLGWSGSFTLNE